MNVTPCVIPGLLVFTPAPAQDDRGFFTRTFDADVGRSVGVDAATFVQDSQSRSHRGVVRGLHVRLGVGETKLVRCSYGSVFDVVLDLRPTSPTYGEWLSFQLDDVSHSVLHVPAGCAHGFQALTEPADVCYRINVNHDPAEDLTVAWNDPRLAIPWPLPPGVISSRDRNGLTWSAARARIGP